MSEERTVSFTAMEHGTKEDYELLAELEKQFRSDSFDAKSLNSLSEKSEQDFQNFRTTLIQRMAEFHGILNQEQKEEAAELIARIRQKHGQ